MFDKNKFYEAINFWKQFRQSSINTEPGSSKLKKVLDEQIEMATLTIDLLQESVNKLPWWVFEN